MTDPKEILGNGISFIAWRMALRAKLGRKNVLGHVFHDMPGIRPVNIPTDPLLGSPNAEDVDKLTEKYLDEFERWTLGEIEAKNIITQRLSTTICPQHYDNLTAKELYDTVAGTRNETATAPYAAALETLLSIRFVSTADDYVDRFLAAYQSVNNAADTISTRPLASWYCIGDRQASAIFVMGTKRIEWLNVWRDTRAFDSDNKYAPLRTLMSSLRSVAGNRTQTPNTVAAVVPNSINVDPEAYCKRCKHRHKNKYCYCLHPELAQGSNNRSGVNRGNGKQASVNSVGDDSESDSGGVIIAASSRMNESVTLYDTGALHHFVPHRSMFSEVNRSPKPFKFDQAVGTRQLCKQGTATLKIGTLSL